MILREWYLWFICNDASSRTKLCLPPKTGHVLSLPKPNVVSTTFAIYEIASLVARFTSISISETNPFVSEIPKIESRPRAGRNLVDIDSPVSSG